MQTSYALYCVHQDKWHYLQSARTLDGVKVGKSKITNWINSMGVILSDNFSTTLVIQIDGHSILNATYGPPHPAWRPIKVAAELVAPEVTVISSANVDQIVDRLTQQKTPTTKPRPTYAEVAAEYESRYSYNSSDEFADKSPQTG